MTTGDNLTNHEQDPSANPYGKLLERISYAFDDGFTATRESRDSGTNSRAEFVQLDNSAIEGVNLFTVTYTASGGQPDTDVETIHLFAHSFDPTTTFSEIIDAIYDGEGLPYRTDEFFISHKTSDRNGQDVWRHSKLTADGLYEWIPHIPKGGSRSSTETLLGMTEEIEFSVSELIQAGVDKINNPQDDEADQAYVRELIDKIPEHRGNNSTNWALVPLN